MSMRAGVLICERKCTNGHLNYPFQLSFLSTTRFGDVLESFELRFSNAQVRLNRGPSLEPEWGEGDFLTATGPYRFAAGALSSCSLK